MSGDMFFGLNLPKLNKVNVPGSVNTPPVTPQSVPQYGVTNNQVDTFTRSNPLLFSGSPVVSNAANFASKLSLNDARNHFQAPNTFDFLASAPGEFPAIQGYDE